MAYLALDMGAGSGRAIVGWLADEKLHLEEVHRFRNVPVKLGDTLYWDFLSLWDNVVEGIRLAVKSGHRIDGIGVDTWGVDFGLVDKDGMLLSNPVCYRDSRTEGMPEKVADKIPPEKLYSLTGIQSLSINTLYQLYSLREGDKGELTGANRLLFTPDLINFFLTGVVANEYTIASTSQMLDARKREWSHEIFSSLELPAGSMGRIVMPGTVLGPLKPALAKETGARTARVFATGSHDTANAIAAIPESGDDWAFLSSGTWSLLGLALDEPVLTPEALTGQFTNEGGCGGKILFMRNLTGLWLLQQLVAEWERAGDWTCDYPELLAGCDDCEPFRSIVDSDDGSFSFPTSMSEAIAEYCHRTGQRAPETKGQFVRCVLESLALKYRLAVENLKKCSGRNISRLHIAGGGSRNELLNRFAADALGMEVVAGLDEGTAVGNIMNQCIANGEIRDWDEAHEIIRNSFEFKTFYPSDTSPWASAAERAARLFG